MIGSRPKGFGWWLAVAGLLLVTRIAGAGAWTRPAGGYYLSVGYSSIPASRWYSGDGTIRDLREHYSQRTVGLYWETGLGHGVGNLLLDWQLLRSVESGGRSVRGIGDLKLGLVHSLSHGPLEVSATVLVGLPAGNPAPSVAVPANATFLWSSSLSPPQSPGDTVTDAALFQTGGGDLSLEPRVDCGTSRTTESSELYASFGGGVRFRGLATRKGSFPTVETTRYAHEVHAGGELGYRRRQGALERVTWQFKLDILSSLASELERVASYSGLRPGVRYIGIGLGADIRLDPSLHLALQVDGARAARYVPAAPQFRVALALDR